MIRIATIFSLLLIAACEQPTSDTTTATGSYQQTLQQQLIMAKPGDVIEIPEGTFEINRALSDRKSVV